MVDLTTKPCKCGSTAKEIISYRHRVTDNSKQPDRTGWICTSCDLYEEAIGREKYVDKSIKNA